MKIKTFIKLCGGDVIHNKKEKTLIVSKDYRRQLALFLGDLKYIAINREFYIMKSDKEVEEILKRDSDRMQTKIVAHKTTYSDGINNFDMYYENGMLCVQDRKWKVYLNV